MLIVPDQNVHGPVIMAWPSRQELRTRQLRTGLVNDATLLGADERVILIEDFEYFVGVGHCWATRRKNGGKRRSGPERARRRGRRPRAARKRICAGRSTRLYIHTVYRLTHALSAGRGARGSWCCGGWPRARSRRAGGGRAPRRGRGGRRARRGGPSPPRAPYPPPR